MVSTSAISAMIQGMTDQLRSSFNTSELIEHHLNRGEFRERVVEDMLKPHLPRRFAFSTGIAVNALGKQSQQQDVLITDSASFGPFLSAGGITLHPIETVAASIQVKTRINAREIKSAVENIASLKELMPPLQRSWVRPLSSADGTEILREEHRMFGGVLAYASSINMETVSKTFADASREVEPRLRPDALFVLDNYALLWGANFRRLEICYPTKAECLHAIRPGDDGLLFFFALLFSTLSSYVAPPLDLNTYIASGGRNFEYTTMVSSEDTERLMKERPQ